MENGIGSYLRKVRKAKGGTGFWSLRSVAKRAGISDSYLSQLETGKVQKPQPDVLRKLAEACRIPYEELLRIAGYLSPRRGKQDVMEIPVRAEISQNTFDFTFDTIVDQVLIHSEFVNDCDCFAIKISGTFLNCPEISDGDILIVSPNATVKNNDIVIARVCNECSICRYHKTETEQSNEQIVLLPCMECCGPVLVDTKMKGVEILGRVIRILKVV